MKFYYMVLLLGLVLALGFFPLSMARAQSVIPNGSVEEGSGSTPDYFYREGPSLALTWADGIAYSGTRSLKAQSGQPGEAWWLTNAFPVEPGQLYRFSTWVRQENVNTNPSDDDYRWAVVIRFGTGQSSGHLSGIIAPDHYVWLDQSVSNAEWYEVSIELTAPPNAQYADWDLRKRHLAAGQVWADVIEAVPLGDELIPGELFAVGIPDGLSVRLNVSGDNNHNATAEVYARPSGTDPWDSQGEMNFTGGAFRTNVTDLPDQMHDVRVLLDDPDGIDGEAEHIIYNVEPGDEGNVILLDWSPTYAEVLAGGYTVIWDNDQISGAVLVSRSGTDRQLAFLLNGFGLDLISDPDSFQVIDTPDVIELEWFKTHAWGETNTVLTCFKDDPGSFTAMSTATTLVGAEFTTSTWPVQFVQDGTPSPAPVTVHSVQQPYGTPAVLIENTDTVEGTAFVFTYETSLSDWFNLAGEWAVQGTGGNENGFGFRPPLADAAVSGEDVILSHSRIQLHHGYPTDEVDVAERYSTGVASALESSHWWVDSDQQDWQGVANQAVNDIQNTDDCWTTVSGQPMLRAYVGAPRPGEAEAISQLDVLVALRYLMTNQTVPGGEQLAQTLTQTLPYFWNDDHQTFVNNAPNAGISGGDSWYTIQLHCDLARLAMLGYNVPYNLLFDSLPAVIAFAQNVNYDFPVFFEYGTWEPISGSEPDVAGAYAWLMLAAWHMTGDDMYFDEAEASIQALRGHGLNLTYEMHMTAASTAACAKLYALTDDPQYLDLLNLSLGNLLRHGWLSEIDFGYAEDYTTFCGFNAMHTINYIAAKEQHEVYRYLREAEEVAGDALDPAIELLLERILSHMDNPTWYSLPPHLDPAAIDDDPVIGYNALDLFIPLEDLRDGAQQSGQIGQELYGAGAVFTFAGGYVPVMEDPPDRGEAGEDNLLPHEPVLHSIYPNPANPAVVMRVTLPAQWRGEELHISISNITGQTVASIPVKPGAGEQLVHWNAADHASGLYFARLTGARKMFGGAQRFVVVR